MKNLTLEELEVLKSILVQIHMAHTDKKLDFLPTAQAVIQLDLPDFLQAEEVLLKVMHQIAIREKQMIWG